MKFRKGNRYRYGQDFRFFVGIPPDVDFRVSHCPGTPSFTLVTPGYGCLRKRGHYGNGALQVWGFTARQRKRFAAEAAREKIDG